MISKLYHRFNIKVPYYGFFVAKNRVLSNIIMIAKIKV
jgi:hypothetical protein